jgi:hypothetical protein
MLLLVIHSGGRRFIVSLFVNIRFDFRVLTGPPTVEDVNLNAVQSIHSPVATVVASLAGLSRSV